MDHMKLTDELRQQLMEASVWKNDEISSRLDESGAETEQLDEKYTRGKKSKKAMAMKPER